MAHLYSTHRVASQENAPRRRSGTRRNFFSDDIEKEEQQKTDILEEEIAFRKKYSHYFDAKDIKKKLHLLKTNPTEFENQILKDPEVLLRLDVAKQKEVQKQELVLKGHQQLKKWSDQYSEKHYEYDEEGIQHFKPSDPSVINDFNDNYIIFSKTVASYVDDNEQRQVEDWRNLVIHKRTERRKDKEAGFPKKVFEDTLTEYTKQVKKSEKEVKLLNEQLTATPNDPIILSRKEDVQSYLREAITKKTIIDDLVNHRYKVVEFGSNSWFDRFKNDKKVMNENLKLYELDKYDKGIFNYTRSYKKHKFVFLPSGGGKSTLEENFSTYLFDVDKLLDYERDEKKFKFLVGYSRYYNKWHIVNNYWKELINMYEHKFRGKVLLCHGPDQLPLGMNIRREQGLIILPSVKRWDLRSFKDNYNHLTSLDSHLKVMLHYRYYFYNIFHFFNLNNDSWKEIRVR